MPLDLRQIKNNDEQELQYSDYEKFDQTEISSTTSSHITGTVPTNLIQEMIDKIDMELTDEQKQDVEQLLQDNRKVFSTSEFDLGRTNSVQQQIDTGSNRPFEQQLLRRHPMAYFTGHRRTRWQDASHWHLRTICQSMSVECHPGWKVWRNLKIQCGL